MFWTAVAILPIAGIIWGILFPADYEAWQARISGWLGPAGASAPAAFVVIQALQVVVAPISHYVVGAVGGFLFGFAWGGALNYIGRLIGHGAAYYLARRFRSFVARKKWVSERTFQLYDRIFVGRNGKTFSLQTLLLFLIYFLPLFPDDEISYLVGFAAMPLTPFVLANIFGQVGGSFSLALIGAGIETRDPWFWLLTILTLIGFPLIWYVYRKASKPTQKQAD